MKRNLLLFFLVSIPLLLTAQGVRSVKEPGVKYYDQRFFLVEGTCFNDSVKEGLYDRFPASLRTQVREPVWNLSRSSAGISVRFFSNSTTIKVKWELLNDSRMNHMAETGIKGIDMYYRSGGGWQYINTARPTGKVNEFLLINNMSADRREYKMYLPLYDGVTRLEVGIDSLATIEKPAPLKGKPVVFYGTSITQGGCASRPGMVHTSIISRKLNVECINFGFSGNGKMEKPVVDLISGINALFYVIECTENMSPEDIRTNMRPLIETIRSRHPTTPVVFVDGSKYKKIYLDEVSRNTINEKNEAIRREYRSLMTGGFKDIYFIEKLGETGIDHEGTVDAVHYTDLGFMRYADFLIAKFRQFKLPLQ